jgi:hypothetical protein
MTEDARGGRSNKRGKLVVLAIFALAAALAMTAVVARKFVPKGATIPRATMPSTAGR